VFIPAHLDGALASLTTTLVIPFLERGINHLLTLMS